MPTTSKKVTEKKATPKKKKTTVKSKADSVKKKLAKKTTKKIVKKSVSKPANKIIVDIISDDENNFSELETLDNQKMKNTLPVFSSWPSFDKKEETEDILSELDDEDDLEKIENEDVEEYDKQKKFFSDWAKQNTPKEEGGKPSLAPEKKSIGLYRRQAVFYLGATLILLLAVVYFFFVKLTILVSPQGEPIKDSVSFNVTSEVNSTSSSSTEISNKVIDGDLRVEEVSALKTYQATTEEVTDDENYLVTGTVTLINKYNKNQTLVATTRLLSPDGKLFRLKEAASIPAGGKVTANVYADKAGSEMATNANTKFTIPGLWAGIQDRIYAENPEALTYQPQVKAIIKQSDLDKAKKDINEVLNLKVKNELQVSGDQAVVYGDANEMTTQVDAKVGDEKTSFTVIAKKKIVVVTFSKDKVAELAKARLSLVVSDDKQLSNFNTSQITYTLENFNEKTNNAEIRAYFTGLMSLKSDSSLIDRNKLVGLNEKQISEYLNTFPEIKEYDLKFWPPFIKNAPNLPDKITIQINE